MSPKMLALSLLQLNACSRNVQIFDCNRTGLLPEPRTIPIDRRVKPLPTRHDADKLCRLHAIGDSRSIIYTF